MGTKQTSTTLPSGMLLGIASEALRTPLARNGDRVITLIFSALALEAYINDLVELCELNVEEFGDDHVALKNFLALQQLAEDSNASLELKLQLSKLALKGESFDKSRNPFQDLSLLIRIRNYLVHARPSKVEVLEDGGILRDNKVNSILRALEVRQLLKLDSQLDSYSLIASEPVAAWAINTVNDFATELNELFPNSYFKRVLKILSSSLSGQIPEGVTKAI